MFFQESCLLCFGSEYCRIWLETSSSFPSRKRFSIRSLSRDNMKTKGDWMWLKMGRRNIGFYQNCWKKKSIFPFLTEACQIRCFKSAYWIINQRHFEAERFALKWNAEIFHSDISQLMFLVTFCTPGKSEIWWGGKFKSLKYWIAEGVKKYLFLDNSH